MFFSWFRWVLYRGYSAFFWECVYFSLLYLSLIFDMFIVECMCALKWFSVSLIVIFLLFVCVSMCLVNFWCVWLCGFKFTGSTFHFFLRICIQMSMFVCVCVYKYVCVCVCVCARAFPGWCFRLSTCLV